MLISLGPVAFWGVGLFGLEWKPSEDEVNGEMEVLSLQLMERLSETMEYADSSQGGVSATAKSKILKIQTIYLMAVQWTKPWESFKEGEK